MPTMTRKQYDAGLDAICERYERQGAFGSPEVSRAMNEAIERFKATATIVETAPAAVARKPKVSKAIKRAVREALTAAGAPKPAPGTGQAPVQPARRPAAPAKAPQEMNIDELTAATGAVGAGRVSPFWRGAGESAPAPAVAETAPARPGKALHQMSSEELEAHFGAAFGTAAEAAGMGSPLWKGINGG